MVRFKIIFLVCFFSVDLMATRMELLDDAINEGGAPTVANLLGSVVLPNDVFHQTLAREAIIMVYLDVDHDEGSDMDALFVAAGLPNDDANLAIVMRLIEAMPPADEGSDSDSDSDEDIAWSEEELFSDDEGEEGINSAAAAA